MSHRVFPSVVPCPVRPRGEPCADGGSCSSRGCLPIFLPAGQELVQQGLTFIFLFLVLFLLLTCMFNSRLWSWLACGLKKIIIIKSSGRVLKEFVVT